MEKSLPSPAVFGNHINVPSIPARFLAACVSAYQHTLSPDHGPLKNLYPHGVCIHKPTCSEYTRTALLERGAVIGSFLGLKRILSCHPWAKISDAKLAAMAAKETSQSH